jgi:hypothetical protein
MGQNENQKNVKLRRQKEHQTDNKDKEELRDTFSQKYNLRVFLYPLGLPFSIKSGVPIVYLLLMIRRQKRHIET